MSTVLEPIQSYCYLTSIIGIAVLVYVCVRAWSLEMVSFNSLSICTNLSGKASSFGILLGRVWSTKPELLTVCVFL